MARCSFTARPPAWSLEPKTEVQLGVALELEVTSECRDLAYLVLTDRIDHFTPCACARGNDIVDYVQK